MSSGGRSREWLILGLPTLLLLALGFYAASRFIQPPPPVHIAIATGADTGDYHASAQHYAGLLARNGIALDVRSSQSSSENLAKLLDPNSKVEIAFVRSGLKPSPAPEGEEDQAPLLVELATIAYEPLWVFYHASRRFDHLDHLAQLRGKRLVVGSSETEVRKLAEPLLEASGLNTPPTTLLPLDGQEAAEALEAGRIDAAFLVASADEPIVRRLLAHPSIRLMSFANAEAYVRRFPFLVRLTLPRGSIDLAADIPHDDVELLATPMSVIIRREVHPALQYQLLQAMSETHRSGGILHKGGQFPSPHEGDFPLSSEARSYFKEGLPFLQQHFPFWIADRLERFWVLIVPLIAIVIPLIKILPPLYSWSVRSRFFRRYGELRYLEDELENTTERAAVARIHARIRVLEGKAQHMRTPLAYCDLLYTFRMHINLVRTKADKKLVHEDLNPHDELAQASCFITDQKEKKE